MKDYLHCTDITVGSNDERRSSASGLLAFQTPTPLYRCSEKTSLLACDMGYMNFFKIDDHKENTRLYIELFERHCFFEFSCFSNSKYNVSA